MTRLRRRPRHARPRFTWGWLLLVVGLALCMTGCGSSTSTADSRAVPDGPIVTAPASCWKRLLHDADDGSIDASYTPRCYRAAISNLPADGNTGLRDVLGTGIVQAVGAVVPPERAWASVRRSVRDGRAGARQTLARWNAWLASDQLSSTPTRFPTPSRRWLLVRLERLQRIYHFQLLGLRYLHRFQGGSRPAPLLIVRADPETFVRATRLVFASLDQQPRPSPTAPVVWNYEAFFLEARDQFGAPFLAVFNNWRAPHPGGGQWATGANLYPFPHG